MPASDLPKSPEEKTSLTSSYHRGPKTLQGIVAGAIAGCSELLISYPIELCKTQLQLDRSGKVGSHTGVFDVLKRTVTEKGFFALYRGMGVVMLFSGPQESIRFGVYEELKSRTTTDENGYTSVSTVFLCGLVAGVAEAIFAVTPMETIKIKLIHDQRSQTPRYGGFFLKGMHQLFKAEGFRGLYQGLTPTLLRQGSNHGIRFCLVDVMKRVYHERHPNKKIPSFMVGIFGVIAGLVSVAANNPIDVAKTRMQGFHGKTYKNTLHCIQRIFQEEGVTAFYKGIGPRFVRVGVDAGYTFMVYEKLMDFLNEFWV